MEITKAFNEAKNLKIETITGHEGSEISFCPARGGIITSIKYKGKELLYMDQDTFIDPKQKVKGGVPILFPNAGPLPEGSFSLPQHGYARMSDQWKIIQPSANEMTEELSADENGQPDFPFELLLKIKAIIEEDGSNTIVQEVTNRDKKDMPISMGLHPYFQVPAALKSDIKFDFPGGEIIERDCENWSKGGTTSIDNPKVNNPEAVLRVNIPHLGTVVMDVSAEYKKIWVWSLPGKDFVCVEPVMRDAGGLENDPEIVKPGQTLAGKVNYRLE